MGQFSMGCEGYLREQDQNGVHLPYTTDVIHSSGMPRHKKSRVGKETQKMSRLLKGKMEKRKKRRLRKEESSIR
jgi:hypothetical protein